MFLKYSKSIFRASLKSLNILYIMELLGAICILVQEKQ